MSPPAPDEEALSSQQAGRPLEGTQTAALGSQCQWCNLQRILLGAATTLASAIARKVLGMLHARVDQIVSHTRAVSVRPKQEPQLSRS